MIKKISIICLILTNSIFAMNSDGENIKIKDNPIVASRKFLRDSRFTEKDTHLILLKFILREPNCTGPIEIIINNFLNANQLLSPDDCPPLTLDEICDTMKTIFAQKKMEPRKYTVNYSNASKISEKLNTSNFKVINPNALDFITYWLTLANLHATDISTQLQ